MDNGAPLAKEVLSRILGSMYPDGDQRLSSFLYGAPGAPHWQRRFAAEIFVKQRQFIEALLFVRRHGGPFLRDISIGSLWSMVTGFTTEHYAYIAEGRLALSPGVSFAEQISPGGMAALSDAMERSTLFNPSAAVTLYPLVPVLVADAFQSPHFAFIASADLVSSIERFGIRFGPLTPTQFPPVEGWAGVSQSTSNWLCVSAPDPLVARKRASATLGAVALTAIGRERYLQTGRSLHGGYCTLSDEGYSCSPGTTPVTPRISSDILLTRNDHGWLQILSSLFDSQERVQKASVRALEYFYRAWFDDPRERFPTLCMSLDSLVHSQGGHTKAAVKFVTSTVGEPVDPIRLHSLMKLRGAVIHGAAPDVYESEHYEAYYSQYGEDPITDLELIVARCLRLAIFDGELMVHPDPHAHIIKQQQALGRLPRNMRGNVIIADD